MAKPAIQAALDRGELSRAHLLLSQWYDEPSLSTAERQEIEGLLSQLAGTVVYSNEHRLEPPYVVSAGETLESIAGKYDVPWQLLAKINGVTRPDEVQAGQKIKVIRGPFTAVVDMSDHQMTLMVEGRYAGKFPVTLAPTGPLVEGEWIVERKSSAPPLNSATSVVSDSKSSAASRSLVLKGAEPATTGASLVLGSPDGSSANSATTIHVTPADAEDLVDILSVGSRVVIRR
jgi:LysM repeat protein